jgi:hypothetical protein
MMLKCNVLLLGFVCSALARRGRQAHRQAPQRMALKHSAAPRHLELMRRASRSSSLRVFGLILPINYDQMAYALLWDEKGDNETKCL